MKHLIIEGCDGTGKSTLINQLSSTERYVQHSRASTSTGGPVPDLDGWVRNDLDFLEYKDPLLPFIYDRHPLISELIYADLRTVNRGVSGGFAKLPWIIESQRRMAKLSVLVICSPSFFSVQKAIEASGKDAHMPGVYDNLHAIYSRYERFIWPGRVVRYNWHRDSFTDLLQVVDNFND